jgi:hypothetical protein
MAAGDRLLDSSGNVILDASGNIMLSDGAGDACCCGSASGVCAPCSSDPVSWTIVPSGIVLCPCATDGSPPKKLTGNPNLTVTATRAGTSCTYQTLSSVSAFAYTSGCSTTTSFITRLTWTVSITSGPVISVSLDGGDQAFESGFVSISSCASMTLNNTLVDSSACSLEFARGYGGSVTITPNF